MATFPFTNDPLSQVEMIYIAYFKGRREVQDTDGSYLDSLKSPPEQHSRLEFEDFRDALAMLPSVQREALLLVGASGFSYEEAAAICETAVGTIKSRVHRARTRLSELLAIDNADRVRSRPHDACYFGDSASPAGRAIIILDPRWQGAEVYSLNNKSRTHRSMARRPGHRSCGADGV
jgi:hypothetical protein